MIIGDSPYLSDIISILANEPYFLSIDQIKKVTPAALWSVYFRERDENGKLLVGNVKPPKMSEKQQFFLYHEVNKTPKWKIEKLWKERGSTSTKQPTDTFRE